MTSRQQISDWFDEGVKMGATHMLVVCDTFDYEDYPVYVASDKDPVKEYELYKGKDMQRVMEIYDLSMDRQQQLGKTRCWNLPIAGK